MARIIGVRFRSGGKVYHFDPGDLGPYELDMGVIVETARGIEYGEVALLPREAADQELVAPLKGVVRIAMPEDSKRRDEIRAKEQDALRICAQKIPAHGLDMKLVDVEYAFDGSKLLFYFTADGRVDFRELVKELASIFRTRIELRQIGVRDEAKMLGGLGACGRQICCSAHMAEFQPVSIRMAKEQGLSLNPTKISGLCGRLMCCLKYEQEHYEATRKRMPKQGKEVLVPDGRGVIIENLILKERIRIKLMMPNGSYEIREYPMDEVRPAPPQEKPPQVNNQAGNQGNNQGNSQGNNQNGNQGNNRGSNQGSRSPEQRGRHRGGSQQQKSPSGS